MTKDERENIYSNWVHRFIQSAKKIIGYVLLIVGSLFALSALVCAFFALTGQLETDNIIENIALTTVFLIIAAVSVGIAQIGWRLRGTNKKTVLPEKQIPIQEYTQSQAEMPSVPSKQAQPQKPTAIQKPVTQAGSVLRKKQCMRCKKVISEKEMYRQGLCQKCWEQKEKEEQVRAEMNRTYQSFLENGGKLPQSYSVPYLRHTAGYCYQGTPFDAYVDKITQNADSVRDESGISDWLHLDECMDINRSAAEIVDWVHRHTEMQERLRKMCHIGNTSIMPPLFQHCTGHVMVILDDAELFCDISEESLADCKAAGVSFCTILSDRKLYDLIEQKEKGVSAVSYPNYHDETYADWYFIDETSWDWHFL